MKVTIHQPEFMPWLGFFHKINMSETFVVLDNVQYRKRYFQNRNKIRTKKGWQWIYVSVKREDLSDQLIKDVEIQNEDALWNRKISGSLSHSYSKSKFFKLYWNDFASIFDKNYDLLSDLNMDIIRYIFDKLGIKRKIVFASTLDVLGKKGDLMFNICKALDADTYISGISGRDYLDFQKFKDNNIEVVIQEFHHPIYKQMYEPFIPCISAVDLLFNYGDESLNIINGIGVPVMEELFL